MTVIENASNFNTNNMYRIQVTENMKFAKFQGFPETTIEGIEYTFSNFINSGNFKVHEVICFHDNGKARPNDCFHVWYENKLCEEVK